MYESFFRFTSRPFVASPLVSSYFASESAEAARQTLIRSIDRAEGPGLIIGPAGVGKTLLCRVLAARFQDTFQVAMLSSTRILTRKALLQNIHFELGLPYRNMEEGELRLSLLDHLQPTEHCPNGILLIVDEAHSLPLRLLEEIRMITNLVRDGQPRVRLVMAGGAKLEEKFASPKLESFNQRIAARCYLEPFGRDDTIDYVRSRLAAAGGNRKADAIFSEDALRVIYQATDGIPRLINQVCDHALVMAFANGRPRIDAAGIEEAWADLQQLPGPWHEAASRESAGATIEFGELDAEQAGTEASEELADEFSAAVEIDSAVNFEASTDDPLDTTTEIENQAVIPVTVRDPFGDGFDEEEVVIDQSIIRSAEIFANRTRVASHEGRELVAAMPVENERMSISFSKSEPATRDVLGEPNLESSSAPDACDLTCDEECSSPAGVEVVSTVEREACVKAENETPDSTEDSVTIAIEPETPANEWAPQVAYGAQMFEYTAFEPNRAADLALEALCDVNVALGDLDEEVIEKPTVMLSDHADANGEDESADELADDDRAIILIESDEQAYPAATPEGAVHRIEYQTLFAQLRQG